MPDTNTNQTNPAGTTPENVETPAVQSSASENPAPAQLDPVTPPVAEPTSTPAPESPAPAQQSSADKDMLSPVFDEPAAEPAKDTSTVPATDDALIPPENSPRTANKRPWVKIILFILIPLVLLGAGYWAYATGLIGGLSKDPATALASSFAAMQKHPDFKVKGTVSLTVDSTVSSPITDPLIALSVDNYQLADKENILGAIPAILAEIRVGVDEDQSSPTISSVSISPTSASIQTGQTQQFSASVTGTGNFNSSVTWSASCGSVNSGGSFTAPASAGTCTVTATSAGDSSKHASASVTVTAPAPPPPATTSTPTTTPPPTATTPTTTPAAPVAITITKVTVSPTSASVETGKTRQFKATVYGTGSYSKSVTWSATGGKISSTGLFTAPATAGQVTITATSKGDASKKASAAVTVTVPAPVTTTPTPAPVVETPAPVVETPSVDSSYLEDTTKTIQATFNGSSANNELSLSFLANSSLLDRETIDVKTSGNKLSIKTGENILFDASQQPNTWFDYTLPFVKSGQNWESNLFSIKNAKDFSVAGAQAGDETVKTFACTKYTISSISLGSALASAGIDGSVISKISGTVWIRKNDKLLQKASLTIKMKDGQALKTMALDIEFTY